MSRRLTIGSAALLIELASFEEQRFARELPAAEAADEGTAERWGAAAMFAHLTDWKDVQVARMRAHLEAAEPPFCDGLPFPHRDPESYAPLALVPWDGMPQRAATTSAELAALARRFTDVDLERWFAWTLGKPLAQQLIGRGVWHTTTHITEYHRQRGHEDEARQLLQRFGARLVELEAWPVRGDAMGHYNVACLCAANGQFDVARTLLAEAVILDPKLAEAARVDEDLAAVA